MSGKASWVKENGTNSTVRFKFQQRLTVFGKYFQDAPEESPKCAQRPSCVTSIGNLGRTGRNRIFTHTL